jgi:hypothetical protein
VKPEQGFADSNLVTCGQEVRPTGGGDGSPVYLHKIIGNKALDHPTSFLVRHPGVQRLNGRMVKSDVVRRISHFPPECDLLRPGSVVTLETYFLLNDLRDEGLQPTGQKLDGSPMR